MIVGDMDGRNDGLKFRVDVAVSFPISSAFSDIMSTPPVVSSPSASSS